MQVDDNVIDHPMSFYSKKLDKHQQKYSVVEKEALSLLFMNILFYVAFCTIMAILRQKKARSRDYALLLFRMTSRVLHRAQYHRQHCTLHAFEQFGALYIVTVKCSLTL